MSNPEFDHITPELVTDVCRQLLASLPSEAYDDQIVFDQLDPITKFLFAEKATDLLVIAIPALLANGWIPPINFNLEEEDDGSHD